MSEKSLKSDSEKVWKSEELYWNRESKKTLQTIDLQGFCYGRAGENRTLKTLMPPDFESGASTNSATTP